MPTSLLLVMLLLADVAPLGPAELQRLASAGDDRDHREEAFAALIENVSAWTAAPGDAPIRLDPDLDGLLRDPASSRGDLCRLRGVVLQRMTLDPPFAAIVEWFIRDDRGRPVIVYLPAAEASAFAEGAPVEIDARFYKRMTLVARDGVERRYAAFVGAHPRPVPREASTTGLLVVAIPVAVLLAVFLALFAYVRAHRTRPRSRGGLHGAAAPFVEEDGPLPDDPVEALAMLRQRAEKSQDAG